MTQRQKILLGVLAGAVVLAVWLNVGSGGGGGDTAARPVHAGGADGEGGDAAPAGRPRQTAHAVNKEVRSIVPLHIADLDRQHAGFVTGRDPWRFIEPPPPPPPKPHVPTAAERRAMEEAEAARQRLLREQAAKAAVEAAKPKPPPFTWTYLGNFGPAGHRIAVFVDGNKVYNAREGEVISDKFIVAQIGFESVDIRFVAFPDWPAQRLAVSKK